MKEKPLNKNKNPKDNENRFVLVLYNDNVNTFDYVIKSLVEICGHDPVQAEQCAMLVHLKGRCEIRKGSSETLFVMNRSLNLKGLNSRVCPV